MLQPKPPEFPPADHDPDGDSDVALNEPSEPSAPAVAARTVAPAEFTAREERDGDEAFPEPAPAFDAFAAPTAGTVALNVASDALFRVASGVCSRHSAFSGVVSAHAGNVTRRRRDAQPAPYAPRIEA
ncbi:hypothetical protein ACWDNT_12335 [Streptomyces sp. NPDC000963]|nr:hypothetical protein [Streptomyces sp. SID2131]